MATFGGKELDHEAVRGLVGRVAIQELVGDRVRSVRHPEIAGAAGRKDGNGLPPVLETFARRGEPFFVGVVRQELARSEREDQVDRSPDVGAFGFVAVAGGPAAVPWRRLRHEVEGGPEAVQVEVESREVEPDVARLCREDCRVAERSAGEMDRLAQVRAARLGFGVGPQGLGRGLAREGVAGVTSRSFTRRSAEARCQSARSTWWPAAITSKAPRTWASTLPEMARDTRRGGSAVPTMRHSVVESGADARAEWTIGRA